MKSLTEQPAILSVHNGTPGQYIVRVADLKYRPVITELLKVLEAESFVLITPSDIKVFSVEQKEDRPEEVQEDLPVEAPPIEPEEVPEPTPRRRKKQERIAGHDENCQRCLGSGRVQISMGDGSASETSCPICKGSGVIVRYGRR